MEYKTTQGSYVSSRWIRDSTSSNGGYQQDAKGDDPTVPGGVGWKLIGTAAAAGMLFWTWSRPVKKVKRD